MLKRFLSGVGVGVVMLALPASAQTVDELIAKNIEARGGLEAIQAATTLRLTGTMTMGPGMQTPFTLELKRPKKMRMEFTFQGTMNIQAYDGTTGWTVMPFMDQTSPELMSPEDLRDAEEQADFDGPLVDHAAKGHSIELLGQDEADGAYKLKVTLESGGTRYVYLDPESFLETRTEGERFVQGRETELETSFGDHREVAGVMIPHVIETSAKGSPQKQTLQVESAEVNLPLDDSRFAMPAPEAAPAPEQD
jgi:outer membrane lipoprotein-sorting protein